MSTNRICSLVYVNNKSLRNISLSRSDTFNQYLPSSTHFHGAAQVFLSLSQSTAEWITLSHNVSRLLAAASSSISKDSVVSDQY